MKAPKSAPIPAGALETPFFGGEDDYGIDADLMAAIDGSPDVSPRYLVAERRLLASLPEGPDIWYSLCHVMAAFNDPALQCEPGRWHRLVCTLLQQSVVGGDEALWRMLDLGERMLEQHLPVYPYFDRHAPVMPDRDTVRRKARPGESWEDAAARIRAKLRRRAP